MRPMPAGTVQASITASVAGGGLYHVSGEEAVQRGDDLRAFADRGAHALDRAGTNVTHGKDAGDARLECIRGALGG